MFVRRWMTEENKNGVAERFDDESIVAVGRRRDTALKSVDASSQSSR
jgi:hypothetical protein